MGYRFGSTNFEVSYEPDCKQKAQLVGPVSHPLRRCGLGTDRTNGDRAIRASVE
jgi:hypothetical protein